MLEIQSLSVNYRGVLALENICATLPAGELIGAIGPNGAGKSTLLKAMLGLVPANAGQVLLNGRPLARQRRQVAYVPQRSQIDWDYPTSAWSVVMMARTTAIGWLRWADRQQRQIVREALERVEMWDLRHRQIGELSGGQQQRIFLARALAQQADLFLMDEPLTGVDKRSERIIFDLLDELREQGKTIIVCSHEWGEALSRYDRLLLLNRRLLANDEPQMVMTLDNIRQAFGSAMQPGCCEGHPRPEPSRLR
ncbi:metal ABC transporter ATP-binding protein [Synechococcus sp. PCC 7336]|uniref:metal ABC transporter ATP-binding protein n=1 Tax=Synechococcus sp. PCC 7336 TaxID=195250 RepID=UPI00034C79C9|nr:ABC transporter ATP-binding protein [Synechococcus sp. PCC 7336]